jgi:hypothetical protein
MIVGGTLGLAAGYIRGRFESLVMGRGQHAAGVPRPHPAARPGRPARPEPDGGDRRGGVPVHPHLHPGVAGNHPGRLPARVRAGGQGPRRQAPTHPVPRDRPQRGLPVAAFGLIALGTIIILEGTLAFLGLSVQPPQATWGSMINEGRRYFADGDYYLTLIPGMVLFFTVFSLNYVGDSMRNRFDVREGPALAGRVPLGGTRFGGGASGRPPVSRPGRFGGRVPGGGWRSRQRWGGDVTRAGHQAQQLAQASRRWRPTPCRRAARRTTSVARRSAVRRQISSRYTPSVSSSRAPRADLLDLAGIGLEVGQAGQDAHVGHDEGAAADRGQRVEAADDLDRRGVDADLLGRLAQGGGHQVDVVGLGATAGEADLAAVGAQAPRPPGEQHVGLGIVLVERHQDRRRALGLVAAVDVAGPGWSRSVLASALRTASSDGRRTSAGRWAQGAGSPRRQSGGRGILWGPPRIRSGGPSGIPSAGGATGWSTGPPPTGSGASRGVGDSTPGWSGARAPGACRRS